MVLELLLGRHAVRRRQKLGQRYDETRQARRFVSLRLTHHRFFLAGRQVANDGERALKPVDDPVFGNSSECVVSYLRRLVELPTLIVVADDFHD